MIAASWSYDVFISYSHADEAWLKGELLPRLEQWGVRVCIDRRHFEEDKRLVAEELTRLAGISRQTLFVVSRNWRRSTFGDYELQQLLALPNVGTFERFLPLLIDDTDVPLPLQPFHVVEAPLLGWDVTWRILRAALIATQEFVQTRFLVAEADFTRDDSDHGYGGFAYEMQLLVANISPNEDVYVFDAIDAVFSLQDREQLFVKSARGIRIQQGKEGLFHLSSYQGPAYFASFRGMNPEGDTGVVLRLERERAAKLPPHTISSIPASVAGKTVVTMTIHLTLANVEVSNRLACVLPPLLRLSESEEGRFHVVLVPVAFLPTSSGIFDRTRWETVTATAVATDPNSVLVSVDPLLLTEHELTGGAMLHSCKAWRYHFFSDRHGGTFSIESVDLASVDKQSISPAQKPACWLSQAILETVRVDGQAAYLMARTSGARPKPQLVVMTLRCAIIDGRWRPMWILPLVFDDSIAGVLADSCEVVIGRKEGWTKLSGAIWNL